MAAMRTLILALSLAAAAAGPAAAQVPPNPIDLQAQQDAAARRAIARDNELGALENRLQTEQAVTQLQTQRLLPPRAPQLRYDPAITASTPTAATQKYPSIPDAALADSNRRVRAASAPR
jgi:hypothetical protein